VGVNAQKLSFFTGNPIPELHPLLTALYHLSRLRAIGIIGTFQSFCSRTASYRAAPLSPSSIMNSPRKLTVKRRKADDVKSQS
jgi:hypothetical protein